MNLKKMAIAALVGSLSLSTVYATAGDALRLGVEGAYPPFSFKQADGTLSGFDVEVALAICEKLQRECKLVEQEWDGMIPALNAQKYDAIVASMSITADRMKRVSFTEKYYANLVRMIAQKGSDLDATAKGLAGKKVGVVRGTTHQCYAEKHLVDSDIRLYNTHEDVYSDLLVGRIDARISDVTDAIGFLKSEEGGRFEFIGDNLEDASCFGEGIGIAVRKGDSLAAEINQAIKAMRADGSYQKISDKYFSVDIYGD